MIINCFLLALIISFFTIFVMYPQLNDVFYANIIGGAPMTLSGWFFAKVFLILSAQTGLLGGIFYAIAKKIF